MSSPTRSRRHGKGTRARSHSDDPLTHHHDQGNLGQHFKLNELAKTEIDEGQVVPTFNQWNDPDARGHNQILEGTYGGSDREVGIETFSRAAQVLSTAAAATSLQLSPSASRGKLRKMASADNQLGTPGGGAGGAGAWRRRSIGSIRGRSASANLSPGTSGGGGGGGGGEPRESVIHLADLGKRYTKDSRVSEAEKLRKVVLRGAGIDRHSTQQSMSSRPSSDSHQPQWLTKDVWVNDINAIDSAMLKLEKQYKSGEMRAFGQNSQRVFRELDQLRTKQQELFHQHIDMEKSVLAEIGHEVPEVETMEERGFEAFGNAEATEATVDLLGAVNSLCEEIQRTSFDDSGQFMSNRSSPSKPGDADAGGTGDQAAVQSSPQPAQLLTREALAQLPRN